MPSDLVVATNRGPTNPFFDKESHELRSRRGAGGLVASIGSVMRRERVTWVCSPMNDAARAVAQRGNWGVVDDEGYRVKYAHTNSDTYDMAYMFCQIPWWASHGLVGHVRTEMRNADPIEDYYAAYKEQNKAIAQAIHEEAAEGASVIVHDYHLGWVAKFLRTEFKRDDLTILYVGHTPEGTFNEWKQGLGQRLDIARDLFSARTHFSGHSFSSWRWAIAFETTMVKMTGHRPKIFVNPPGPDLQDLLGVKNSDAYGDALTSLEEELNGRMMILIGACRIEPTKALPETVEATVAAAASINPRWHEDILIVVKAYPSRNLPLYKESEAQLERWRNVPGVRYMSDDAFPATVAALSLYNLKVVGSWRDGYVLTLDEGALLNRKNGVQATSVNVGAWDHLGPYSHGFDPFNPAQRQATIAAGIESALLGGHPARAAQLREAAARHTNDTFFNGHIAALESLRLDGPGLIRPM